MSDGSGAGQFLKTLYFKLADLNLICGQATTLVCLVGVPLG